MQQDGKVVCKQCGEEYYNDCGLFGQTHNCIPQTNQELYNSIKEFVCVGKICDLCDIKSSACKYFTSVIEEAKTNAALLGYHKFKLNVNTIAELWKKQDGKCFYSQRPLTYVDNCLLAPTICLINRDENGPGYIIDNIVWAFEIFNRNDLSVDYIIKVLSKIDMNLLNPIRLECKIIGPNGKLPTRARVSDAAWDIYSSIKTTVLRRSIRNIDTGIIVTAPVGYFITIEPRSGLARKSIFPVRGIIDATYHGELKVALINHSDDDYSVEIGDRIGQLMIHEQKHCDFVLVDEFSSNYCGRGDKGFGSSGR